MIRPFFVKINLETNSKTDYDCIILIGTLKGVGNYGRYC